MNSTIRKILTLVVVIIMALGSFIGCSLGIKFNIVYDKMGGFGYKETNGGVAIDMLELVNSLQDLKDLCDEWNNLAFDEESESFSSELSEKIRSYDEAYFSDKVLIIYSFWRGHRKETRINSIEVEGTQLIVNARYNDKRGIFTDEAFNWLILIEVSKVDIVGATTVQIVHK